MALQVKSWGGGGERHKKNSKEVSTVATDLGGVRVRGVS